MKITVKTTQQKVFQVGSYLFLSYFDSNVSFIQIEVESGESVAALKAKIYESQGHPVAVQKIIYSGNLHGFLSILLLIFTCILGKILTDDKTIDSCGIKEKDFLVLMVSKVISDISASIMSLNSF
jgi:UV excision repair protein RAD23